MKNILRLTLLLAAMAVVLAGCEKQASHADDRSDNDGTATSTERLIVYTVNGYESHQTLTSETEWDGMLEQLCDYAQNGSAVTLYTINRQTRLQNASKDPESLQKGGRKEAATINTTNRDEMKSWIKEMEGQGLTVRISYDSSTGTWHGEAYATAPAYNTMDFIVDSWHFTRMVVAQEDSSGRQLSMDVYVPDEDGGTMYYTFTADGVVTLTVLSADGDSATEDGEWSLTDDGMLNSDLLPNEDEWNVNWITGNTMILSHSDFIGGDRIHTVQLQFRSATAED